MSYAVRKAAESGFYHVTLRGNGRQLLFNDESDYRAFLGMASDECAARGVVIIAYCLMGNHVHLILRIDPEKNGIETLSSAMHVLALKFARRFNAKTGHVGHVFQGRFGSKPIEDDAYLLEAVRYVHANPETGGICALEEYPWSSYREYRGVQEFIDPTIVLEMLGGSDAFAAFCRESPALAYRAPGGARVAQEEMLAVARAALGDGEPRDVAGLPPAARDRAISRMRAAGLSIRQVERLTGIGRAIIAAAK